VKPAVPASPAFPPKKNSEIIQPPPLPANNLHILVGKVGIVTVTLSPAGKVRIDNKAYDAVAEKKQIGIGTKVKVFGVTGKKYLQVQETGLPPLPPKK